MLRSVRQEVTTLEHRHLAFASALMRSAPYFGNGWVLIDAPDLPASGATFATAPSLMKGMIGCARRSVASSSRTSTLRVPRAAAALPALCRHQ